MILEIAILDVVQGQGPHFEAAFAEAEPLIMGMSGYRGHELRRCVETASRYLLLVHWDSLEDHTVGFRGSELFRQWRTLIGPHFDGAPVVEHYAAR